MKIRKFQNKDARKVSYVIAKTMRTNMSKDYSKGLIDAMIRNRQPKDIIKLSKKRDFYVAEQGDRILGVAALEEDDVHTMFVNPLYQGKGIGKKLIERVEILAKKRKIKKLSVKSTKGAEKFYQRMGFKKKGLYRATIEKYHPYFMNLEKKL